jgi:hypothetical protein
MKRLLVCLALVLASVLGGAQGMNIESRTGTVTSVTSAAADTLLLAANSNRKGAAIYNDSTAVLSISLSTTAASTTSFTYKIAAAGYWQVPDGYTGMVRGIWASANGAARVTEFT